MSTSTAAVELVSRAPQLLERFQAVRDWSRQIVEPLEPEDCVIQSMPDVSPMRWHLAHTTWFFETFVIKPRAKNYKPFDEAYEYLFNSYYNAVGKQFPRAQRGLLSRPTVSDVLAYRRYVDERVTEVVSDLLESGDNNGSTAELLRVIELGIHHEQQHQELMLTDIKHVFSCNPIWPVYREPSVNGLASTESQLAWHAFEEGIRRIGHDAAAGFAFDNESPRHRQFLHSYELAGRLTTNGEYLQFVESGGYQDPQWWLSAGWATVQDNNWQAPLYWVSGPEGWQEFTLSGLQALDADAPVCHVSYFEADAFARWSGARLPTEAEWEVAAETAEAFGHDVIQQGNFAESQHFHPQPCEDAADECPRQLAGDVWEWTSSSYSAYPGYAPPPGALGEYNGKFMCNQYVLRGGSCATPASHVRQTYRNFFPPDARWQFSGIRLAKS